MNKRKGLVIEVVTPRGIIEFQNSAKGIPGFIKLLNKELNCIGIYINYEYKNDKE